MLKQFSDSKKIQASLDVSWKEGIAASVMLGATDHYFIPFGIFLAFTTPQIALLSALPTLGASIFQLYSVAIVRRVGRGSRLKFLVAASAAQGFLLFPAACLALIPRWPLRIAALVFLVTAFRIFGNWIGTAWGSLVSDYLAPNKRGHYIGWRSQVTGIASLAGVFFGGIWLFLTHQSYPGLGFFILFVIAALFRFISSRLMAKMTDLPLSHMPENDFTFLMFIRRFRESNFVKFVLYVAVYTLAVYIASPFFSVYMLRDLRWGYLDYTVMNVAATVASLVGFPIWGRHADVVGNAQMLRITSFLISFIPFLWIVSDRLVFLVWVQVFAGFLWGGFNLCVTNYIFDAVSPEKRVRCLGYFHLIHGVALFAGTSLGGWLADRLPPIQGHSMLTLFLISGLARLAAHFIFSAQFREVRESARRVPSVRLFFSVVGIDPLTDPSPE